MESYVVNLRGWKVQITGKAEDIAKTRKVSQLLREIALNLDHGIMPYKIEHED